MHVLCIDGARANRIMQRLCELMSSFEAPISDTRQSSVQSSVVCETLVDLQQDQFRSDSGFGGTDGPHNFYGVAISEFHG